ncbi:hypothetical protein CO165_02300 [Candidatus Roizmanbacteria bacterium CG_4_9_14_3_um_filter_33_18]|uniref:Uncharacterized protein n=3 Tax=Candidatus Roizmaniibacteriota TaxID=1752723 RepID=A0A2M7U8W0_9BACT|nr:MAG: hypothetical protein COY12_01420 [Candidatus Roizmanbacteria bacterium CG_4_10_14_0_2_um_filter_33_96]PJA55676.1 MAG: hypothetical protein CO165_02300 [Candidatus Roizmanbacteria bacterium CG_4_9_14_3_um_filter_33_18]
MQFMAPIERRDFLKFTASIAAALLVNALIPPNSTGLCLVDLAKSIPYRESDFRDRLGVLPNNWEKTQPKRGVETLYNDRESPQTAIEECLARYSIDNIPFAEEIPLEVLSTPPFHLIKLNSDDEQSIRAIADGQKRFEAILKINPPITKADYLPAENFNKDRYGKRVELLWERYLEVTATMAACRKLMSSYEDLIKQNQKHPKLETIQETIKRLWNIQIFDLFPNFQQPTALELTARTSNTHFINNPSLWPETPLIFGSCFNWAFQIADLACKSSNNQNESPISSNSKDEIIMKYPSSNQVRDIIYGPTNLTKWMENESSKYGWEEFTDKTYEQMLEDSKGKFIIGQSFTNQFGYPEPDHTFIMRRSPLGLLKDEVFLLAESMGSPPRGELYLPITKEKFNLMKNEEGKKYKFFAHKY